MPRGKVNGEDMNDQISSFLAHLQIWYNVSKAAEGDKFHMTQIFQKEKLNRKPKKLWVL